MRTVAAREDLVATDLEESPVKSFVLDFGNGETTGILEIEDGKWTTAKEMANGNWFDLSGRKMVNGESVSGRLPKGVYIHNGKKVVIK